MKVVVVGGGYGGTEVIRQLVLHGVRNIEVELISDKRYFENVIAGLEIISEKMKIEELRYDLKELTDYWSFGLTIGNIKFIDLKEKRMKVDNKEKDYDILVIAAGAEANYFSISGSKFVQCAYHLTDNKIINERLRQLSAANPNVVIIGAGCVGLEAAAETLDLFKAMNQKVNVTVIEKLSTLIPSYNNSAAQKMALEYFSSYVVKTILGKGVKQIEKERIILEDGSEVETDLTIWTAGIKSSDVATQIDGAKLVKGYVEVDERLLINGRDDSFAIGDISYAKIGGKEAAKMAAEAMEQGKTVAKNIDLIAKGQKPSVSHAISYSTDEPKILLSLGEGKAMLIFGPYYASIGGTEYFFKKRIDVDEIMSRFPH